MPLCEKKAFAAQYIAHFSTVENRRLAPVFIMKNKSMKCFTLRYSKVNPKMSF